MIPPDYYLRVTPELITHLADNEVFVFGSNRRGAHGSGAAKTARKWGAIMGQGEGLMGKTYGIPTKDRNIQTLSLGEIGLAVDRFLRFAKKRPDLRFLVTAIGTGLAHLKAKDVGPLFDNLGAIPPNIHLPKSFWDAIEKYHNKMAQNGKGQDEDGGWYVDIHPSQR